MIWKIQKFCLEGFKTTFKHFFRRKSKIQKFRFFAIFEKFSNFFLKFLKYGSSAFCRIFKCLKSFKIHNFKLKWIQISVNCVFILKYVYLNWEINVFFIFFWLFEKKLFFSKKVDFLANLEKKVIVLPKFSLGP